MGNVISGAMEENMKKSQAAMAAGQRQMLSRQIEMQITMGERQMAMQMAGARDTLRFTSFALGSVGAILLLGAVKKGNPMMAVPLIPISTLLAYQYDFAYGSKVFRIRQDAERILVSEPQRLMLPGGPPSVELVDGSLSGDLQQATLAEAAARFASTGHASHAAEPPLDPLSAAPLSGPARVAFYEHMLEELRAQQAAEKDTQR